MELSARLHREENADEVDHPVMDVLRICLDRDLCLCVARHAQDQAGSATVHRRHSVSA